MPEIDWTYVARDGQVLTGEAARPMVEKTNDRRYLTRDAGIHTVSVDRWRLAQDAERHRRIGLRAGSDGDRILDHAFMYDRYSALHEQTFENAIELGCGPSTNTAVLAQRCTIRRLSLLDPLIEEYRALDDCAYRDGGLRTQSGAVLPVAERIAQPIEQFQSAGGFDLVLLLGVIEHCYNAPVIFRKVWDMLAPGGVVLFHDRYHDHARVAAEAERVCDVARPLRVDRRLVNDFLRRFQGIFFRTVQTRKEGTRAPIADTVYFVGRKPEAATAS
jgi:SAM-dependent methyltransferase